MMYKSLVFGDEFLTLFVIFSYGHVHTAAKFGCQFIFYSLIAFCTHTIH